MTYNYNCSTTFKNTISFNQSLIIYLTASKNHIHQSKSPPLHRPNSQDPLYHPKIAKMMDPKKYDELLQQEDHYRQKFNVQIYLSLATEADCNNPIGPQIHSAIMTINGECFIARNSPVFRSDEKGAFYRQIDAMANARLKLVGWFKEMSDKGFMSYKDEQAYITNGHLSSRTPSGILNDGGEYIDWLSTRRVEYLDTISDD
ncbi:a6725c2c-b0f8-48f8-ba39-4e3e77d58507 [Sclerotinia trifoliorum]|uniref:A6725c2c-b0f8-48f8-ba39-4e3e77d58507 n=1 Tax=Sclerotinia trifoliorum TaxID=28548 RepID=A0A8H2VP71_9HELO|nr:a6725c2c-b0f8-48f8-ba39-4e3e77d58507 [Sclerotinia trifoliorum]